MYTKESELVFIYNVEQLPALERFMHGRLANSPELIVASLDAEVDTYLRDQHIQFISARDFRAKDSSHFLLPEKWLSFLEQPEWSWFGYRDIFFGKLFFPTFQDYVRQATYYVDIIVRVCNTHKGINRIIVLAPTQEIPRAGAFIAKRQISIVIDCAQLVGAQRDISVVVCADKSTKVREHARTQLFVLQRALFSAGLSIVNLCTNLLRPRGTLRILASDYWRNIAPALQYLPGAEVILCDRKQVFNVRLRNAWRYRMRFMSLNHYKERGRARVRDEAMRTLLERWEKAELSVTNVMLVGDISLKPLFDEVLEEVVHEWLPALLEKIDELYALVDTLRPDIVLLRATVSQQWHFPLLALIATVRGIPSLELLHGMEYPGPGSADKRHVAQYLGVYGTHTQQQMLQAGFKKENLPLIGSPRFDLYELKKYAQSRNEQIKDTSHPVRIFCTAPDLFLGASFDTYDIEEYFSAVATAVREIPGATMIIKLRPGSHRETFYRRAIADAFTGISHTIAQYESLRELFPKTDLAVSCQSTVTLEALQCGVPLVLFAATPVETLMLKYNFTDFSAKGAVALCLNTEALSATLLELAQNAQARGNLSHAARTFLDREYSFDGRGAERAAAFIRAVTKKGYAGTSDTITK